MPAASRLTDTIAGMTAGEHSTHAHGPLPITGYIYSATSKNVIINDLEAATVQSVTIEYDDCCGHDFGIVAVGSSKCFVNGKASARIGDALRPHNGTANVTGGSHNVFIGG